MHACVLCWMGGPWHVEDTQLIPWSCALPLVALSNGDNISCWSHDCYSMPVWLLQLNANLTETFSNNVEASLQGEFETMLTITSWLSPITLLWIILPLILKIQWLWMRYMGCGDTVNRARYYSHVSQSCGAQVLYAFSDLFGIVHL